MTTPIDVDIAAQKVADAAELAKRIVAEAVLEAQRVARNSEQDTTKHLAEALREVFGENQDSHRFIDISRIPLICKSIFDIHENLKTINTKLDNTYLTKEAFYPVKVVVYGLVGTIMMGFIGAIIRLTLK